MENEKVFAKKLIEIGEWNVKGNINKMWEIGVLIKDKEVMINRMKKYFEELFNVDLVK